MWRIVARADPVAGVKCNVQQHGPSERSEASVTVPSSKEASLCSLRGWVVFLKHARDLLKIWFERLLKST